MKRLISLLLAAVLTWGATPSFAAIETVPVAGTTAPAVISVDVPLAVSFSISDTQFTSVPMQIVNRGEAPVDIGLLSITAAGDNQAKVVAPDAHNWAAAGTEVTTHNIALGIEVDGATYWSPAEDTQPTEPENEFLLKSMETKPVKLSARHGTSWPQSSILDYTMTLSIRMHGSYTPCVRFVAGYPGTETKDVYVVVGKETWGASYRVEFSAEPFIGHRLESVEFEALPSVTALEYPGGQIPLELECGLQATGKYYIDVTKNSWSGPTIPTVASSELKPFADGAFISNKTITPTNYGIQYENVYRIIATDNERRQDYLRVHVVLTQKK